MRVAGSFGDFVCTQNIVGSVRRTSGAAMAGMVMTDTTKGDSRAGDGRMSNGIVWFKHTDLRLMDHEPFSLAHRHCSTVTHVFCVDDRWFSQTK